MKIDFKRIDYLQYGSQKQKSVYRLLIKYQILDILNNYNPIVVGTIPIGIDIEQSDIDIILDTDDFQALGRLLTQKFSEHLNFKINLIKENILICNFDIENFPIEIYATTVATEKQNGYLHMLKEYEIMQSKDEEFVEQIRNLKRSGIKTEPAFCKLLNIQGDPYIEILKYK